LPFLTCWVHHTLYLWLVYFTLHSCLAGSVGILYLLELPTFLMALGTVFPNMRTDLGFGGSFFSLRLAYHFWVCYHGFLGLSASVPARSYIFAFGIFVGFIHIYWGYQWIVGQVRRSRARYKNIEKHV